MLLAFLLSQTANCKSYTITDIHVTRTTIVLLEFIIICHDYVFTLQCAKMLEAT